MKSLVFSLIMLVPLSGVHAIDLREAQPLTQEKMAEIQGSGCGEALGISMGFAFASGVTVGLPPASAAFLFAAVVVGMGTAILC